MEGGICFFCSSYLQIHCIWNANLELFPNAVTTQRHVLFINTAGPFGALQHQHKEAETAQSCSAMKAHFNFFTLWKRHNSCSLAAGKLNPIAVSFKQRGANSGAQRLMRHPVQKAEAWRREAGCGWGSLHIWPPLPSYPMSSVQAEAEGRGRKSRGCEHSSLTQLPTYFTLLQSQPRKTTLFGCSSHGWGSEQSKNI